MSERSSALSAAVADRLCMPAGFREGAAETASSCARVEARSKARTCGVERLHFRSRPRGQVPAPSPATVKLLALDADRAGTRPSEHVLDERIDVMRGCGLCTFLRPLLPPPPPPSPCPPFLRAGCNYPARSSMNKLLPPSLPPFSSSNSVARVENLGSPADLPPPSRARRFRFACLETGCSAIGEPRSTGRVGGWSQVRGSSFDGGGATPHALSW